MGMDGRFEAAADVRDKPKDAGQSKGFVLEMYSVGV